MPHIFKYFRAEEEPRAKVPAGFLTNFLEVWDSRVWCGGADAGLTPDRDVTERGIVKIWRSSKEARVVRSHGKMVGYAPSIGLIEAMVVAMMDSRLYRENACCDFLSAGPPNCKFSAFSTAIPI